MTTIIKLKAALAALQKNGEHLPVDFDYHFEAMEDLRSVIAEMEAGEPVATITVWNHKGHLTNHDVDCFGELPEGTHQLYTHPQPKAEPADGTLLKQFLSEAKKAGVTHLNFAQPKAEPVVKESLTTEGTVKESLTVEPVQEPVTGCACRWDADDNRVATCVRHQGWLDVVHEWAERAKAAEAAALQTAPVQEPGKLTPDQKDAERAAFEQWYVENAFNYERDPLGSKLCGDQWAAWKYRAAAPQAKPLTDAQIAHIVDSITVYQGEYPHAIARAIEAAHGIKP